MNKLLKFLLQLLFLILVLLAVVAAYFLTWDKYRNKEIWSLNQVKGVFKTVPSSPIDPINNYRVVYVNGEVSTKEKLVDNELGLSVNAISMSRKVLMYQWEEKTQIDEQNKETTYHYQKTWSEHLIDSSAFHFKHGHDNPQSMSISSKKNYASKVSIGDFILTNALIKKIISKNKINFSNETIKQVEKKLERKFTALDSDTMICTGEIDKPRVGDICIEVTVTNPQTMSIIAQQFNHQLRPYLSPVGISVSIIDFGKVVPSIMIENALRQQNWHNPLQPLDSSIRKGTGF